MNKLQIRQTLKQELKNLAVEIRQLKKELRSAKPYPTPEQHYAVIGTKREIRIKGIAHSIIKRNWDLWELKYDKCDENDMAICCIKNKESGREIVIERTKISAYVDSTLPFCREAEKLIEQLKGAADEQVVCAG